MSKPPKFILGLSSSDIDSIRRNPSGSEALRDPDLLIVKLPMRNPDELLRRLDEGELLRRGGMLIRSPFDESQFIDIADAPEQIALAKFSILSLFCSYLGAKLIRVQQLERMDESGRVEAKYNFSALNFESNAQDEVMRKIVRSITHTATFAGSEPDFEAAQALVAKAGITDITFASILEMRRARNQVQRVEQVVSLTKEVRSSLDRLAKIKFPEQLGELSSGVNDVRQKIREYSISIVVDF